MAALDTANWDKATLDYYNQLQAYKQQMEGKGFNVYDPNLVYGSFNPKTGFFDSYVIDPSLGISILPPDLLQGEDEAYYAGLAGRDPSSVYQSVMEFGGDPKFGSLGRVIADPNAQYRLVDVSGGNKVVYSGTGTDALQAIHALTPEYSKDATSQWRIESLGSGSKEWQSTPAFKPDQSSGFGKWLLGALPMVLIPSLAPVLGPAVGSALGVSNTVGGALAGAAIGGGLSAAAGADPLMALVSAGLGGLGGAAMTPSAASTLNAQVANTVNALSTPANLVGEVGSSIGSGLSGAASGLSAAAPAASGLAGLGDIVVTAPAAAASALSPAGALGSLGAGAASIGSALNDAAQQAADQAADQTTQQPTLEQQFDTTFGTGTQQAPTGGGGLASVDPLSGELTVTAGHIPGIGAGNLANAVGPALGALSGVSGTERLDQLQPDTTQTTQQTQEQPVESKDDIVVKAWNAGSDVNAAAAAAGITVAEAQAIIQAAQTAGTADLRKVAETQTTTGALPPAPLPTDIVVTAKPEPQTTTKETFGVDAATQAAIDAATKGTTQTTDTTKADAKTEAETPKEKSTLDKIIDYLQIAGLGTGLIGDLLSGGGGGGALGTIPAGLFTSGTGTSIFNKPLPAPNLPGLGPGGTGIGARSPSDFTATTGLPTPGSGASNIDWYRYGYGPEQSFFKQVPQGAKNASQAFTGYEVPFRGLQNMAEGGYAEADDDTNERIARKRIEEEQRASGGNYSVKRSPKFRHRHSFDDGLFSNYMLDVPVGEGSLLLNAGGKGVLPEYYTVGAQYPLGDMGLRASHTLHGGSEYGVSGPLLGGDVDVSAYSGRGFVPEGARLSYRRRFDDGGYAVGGPGDGRDDKIPAMLSDGEYVMDAETVAMLGNGSSKAGADALDRFRVNIRKHKGRSMARGNFSVKAKKPEKYLQKDRA